ncbi:hypothetical protein CXG81DRAFT_25317 [Caulochytrium protostelioides]|uniref:SUI1 domain-containing protein n=1 Tax=Caulochytrium protostelioides TaxID=1555241 RepID=A0A4P9X9K2_9FUNG|nr:hypothetical protein CXG81DRAFT_25317 [Caulochytrium protostelioides]|eukprot:RKP02024.1 hypothetical protein CXG81DRAFT_25317 [Caulochytrium protostelioides]
MFAKKFTTSNRAPVRKSAARRVPEYLVDEVGLPRNEVGHAMAAPPPSQTGWEPAVPFPKHPADQVMHQIIRTSADVSGTLYDVGNCPYLLDMQVSDFKGLFPTLQLVWQMMHGIPFVGTHAPVMKRLFGGAALMAPGIHMVRGVNSGVLAAGTIVSVGVPPIMLPLAIGCVVTDIPIDRLGGASDDPKHLDGRAIKILHTFGDHLWNLYPLDIPTEIPSSFFPNGAPKSAREMLLALETSAKLRQQAKNTRDDDTAAAEATASTSSSPPQEDHAADDASAVPCATSQDSVAPPSRPSSRGDANESSDAAAAAADADAAAAPSMDDMLIMAFLQALSELNSKPMCELPIIASVFYSKYIQPAAPAAYGVTMDIKQSKYKKLSKFIKEMEKRGLCRSRERNKELVLTHLELGHDDVMGYDGHVTVAEAPLGTAAPSDGAAAASPAAPASSASASGKLSGAAASSGPASPSATRRVGGSTVTSRGDSAETLFQVLYRPKVDLVPLWREVGKDSMGYYTEAQVRTLLKQYAQREQLLKTVGGRQGPAVQINATLAGALLTPEEREGQLAAVPLKLVVSRAMAKMTTYHRFLSNLVALLPSPADGPEQLDSHAGLRTGVPAPITIAIGGKQRIKTTVNNLAAYGIEPEALMAPLRQKLAAGVSVVTNPNRTRSVVVQGRMDQEVQEVLLTKFHLSDKFVAVIRT